MGHVGFQIASVGPERVYQALREDLPTPGLLEKAQGHLGPLYHWLSRSARQPEYRPIKDAIRHYIVNSFPIGAGETVFGEEVQTRRVHSFGSFQTECRMSGQRVRAALVEHGFLTLDPRTGAVKEPGTFSATKSKGLMNDLNDGLTRLATSKLLNIPRAQFGAVCEAGFVTPIVGLGDITPHFSSKAAGKLLSGMMRNAVPVEHFSQEMVDIPTACRKLVCGAAEVIQLIIDDRCHSLGKMEGVTGYLSLRVDVREFAFLLDGVGIEGFTKADLKTLLGVNDPGIKFLFDEGYIQASKSRNPKTRKVASVVTQASLDQFLGTYAPAKELGVLFSLKSPTIIAKLKSLGVEKLTMPSGGIGSIYIRDQALSALKRSLSA